ncbi:hypothetical protein B4O83_01430 [Chromohalobacter israelensis]|nr:hypothetical protein B4O83_01430 [Chromohalobacter salexigens]
MIIPTIRQFLDAHVSLRRQGDSCGTTCMKQIARGPGHGRWGHGAGLAPDEADHRQKVISAA